MSILFILLELISLWQTPNKQNRIMTDKEKQKRIETLTPIQFAVTQESATERPFTGTYYQHREKGTYHCIVCGALLFESSAKFDSPCGWPSFDAPAEREHVLFIDDYSHGMHRIEVRCAYCDAHLGHLFPDGPTSTGNRYCINSAALNFHAAEKKE